MKFHHPLSPLAALLFVLGCAGDAEPDADVRTEADSGLDAAARAAADTVPRLIAMLEIGDGLQVAWTPRGPLGPNQPGQVEAQADMPEQFTGMECGARSA